MFHSTEPQKDVFDLSEEYLLERVKLADAQN